MKVENIKVFIVTDRSLCGEEHLCALLEKALAKGGESGAAVQLREKDLGGRALFELATRVKEVCDRLKVPLFINDRLDVALAVSADGVHLGSNSFPAETARRAFPNGLIGVSAHDIREALTAEEKGADFITYGPIYYTPSKMRYGKPLGTDAIKIIKRKLKIPIFAIGGITAEKVDELLNVGVSGVAVCRSILSAEDPQAAYLQIANRFY